MTKIVAKKGKLYMELDIVLRVPIDLSFVRDDIAKTMKLTDREKEVLRKLPTGAMNKEIAYDLNVTESAIKYHISNLLRKFGVSSRTEMVTILQTKQ